MSAPRVKQLLFEVSAMIERAKTSKEYDALMAKYRALKNQWNKLTSNAVIYEVIL